MLKLITVVETEAFPEPIDTDQGPVEFATSVNSRVTSGHFVLCAAEQTAR